MLFILYNVIAILLFGIPESLTKTFYKYKAHHDSFKFMYYVFVALMCILLTPCWLKLSKTNFAQDTAVINILALIFMGASPIILKGEDTDRPLTDLFEKLISYCCSMFFIIWIVAATPYWWIILLTAIIVTLISIITKSWNKCYTYWIEIIAFASTFIAILLKYIM
jgi:hypothetical protein